MKVFLPKGRGGRGGGGVEGLRDQDKGGHASSNRRFFSRLQ